MAALPTYPGVGSTPWPPGYAGPPSGYYPPGYSGQAPWTQPIPQRKSTNTGAIIAISLAVVLILAIAAGAIGLALHGLPGSSSLATTISTATPAPTATPQMDFSASVPGPGCGTLGWGVPTHQSSSLVKCGASSVTLQEPASNSVTTSIFWDNPYPDSTFTARATVGPLMDACGGVGFQSDYRAYLGYVCADGNWYIVRYDDTGSPTQQSSGAVGAETQYTVSVTVTTDAFALTIDGAQVSGVDRANGYEATHIQLEMYHYKGDSGSVAFSNFSFAHSS
jgi:hypothetical protein